MKLEAGRGIMVFLFDMSKLVSSISAETTSVLLLKLSNCVELCTWMRNKDTSTTPSE